MVNIYTYLELYLDNLSKQVSLSEFETHFKKPHQTIKVHLNTLIKNKILILDKRTRFSFYSLNKTNPLTKEYLSICEKERLFAFLKNNALFRRLYELIKADKILLFGSSVKSKSFEDIDLLILGKVSGKAVANFMKTYTVKIHVIETDEKSLTDSFIKEIQKQHIILKGHDYFIERLYKNELGLVQEAGNETHRA